jgi:ATP-dependent exoDNAse (exonuclease V) beta subunit
MTPTGARSWLAMPERARRAADAAEAAGAVPDTPSHRVDAGAAWGSLLHGLLEHAMRHPAATREDLARLALWLTVESADLRPFVPEALDVVAAVAKAPFWQAAQAAGEVCVEVPFAVRLEAGQGLPGTPAVDRPIVLRGVIDLAHRAADGWHVVDYKTDQLDGVADVDAEMLARHGVQLGQYRFAWERVTEAKVVSAGIVPLRTLEARADTIPGHNQAKDIDEGRIERGILEDAR